MSNNKRSILVFGATGQQGGSVAYALLKAGWSVRALVRDLASNKSVALRDAGVETVRGDFNDAASLRAAMDGVHGVFSVQPSSGMGAELGLSDADEERYGMLIADLAVAAGVQHLVYTSGGAVGGKLTGMGHFDSKARIEAHIRALPLTATIIRPVAFMEMLVMPGFGLDQGQFNFFAQPDAPVQLLAVEDIGKFAAAIFADVTRFGGQTLEIASGATTGRQLETLFTEMAGRRITYARLTDDVLAVNPFLRKLTDLFDQGRLSGKADLDALRLINPAMQSVPSWLAGSGRRAFDAALGAAGTWAYNAEK